MSERAGGAPEFTPEGLVFGGGIGALKVGAEPGVVGACAGGWTLDVIDGAAGGTLSDPSLPGMAGGIVGAVGSEGVAGAAGSEGVAGATGGAAMLVGKAGAGI